jgi:ABC-type transporter Mla subunit MlaD
MNLRPPARRRRRTDLPQHRQIIVRSSVTTGFLLLLGYIAVSSYNGVPGKSYDHVTVQVPRIGSLIAHDLVRIRGKRVGQVRDITSRPDGSVELDLQLAKGTAVPSDSRVMLRANGLLGARYVELIPGRSTTRLADDAVLRGTDAALTFGVADALDTFDSETRGGLSTMLGGLGQAVLGRGPGLNVALDEAASAIVPAQRLLGAVADQRGLGRLLPSLDAAFGTLARSREPLGKLLRPASEALAPLDRQRAAVRATLRQAPGSLAAASRGLDQGADLLDAVHALAVDARPALRAAPTGLRSTAALLADARAPLRDARPLVAALGPAVPGALKLTKPLRLLARPLNASLSSLRATADEVAPHRCDIINFGVVFRSMTGMGSIGDGPAGPAMEFRLQAAVTPPEEVLGTTKLTGLVKRIGYPAPCQFLATPYPSLPRPGDGR